MSKMSNKDKLKFDEIYEYIRNNILTEYKENKDTPKRPLPKKFST
jgi:hypothetical protein